MHYKSLTKFACTMGAVTCLVVANSSCKQRDYNQEETGAEVEGLKFTNIDDLVRANKGDLGLLAKWTKIFESNAAARKAVYVHNAAEAEKTYKALSATTGQATDDLARAVAKEEGGVKSTKVKEMAKPLAVATERIEKIATQSDEVKSVLSARYKKVPGTSAAAAEAKAAKQTERATIAAAIEEDGRVRVKTFERENPAAMRTGGANCGAVAKSPIGFMAAGLLTFAVGGWAVKQVVTGDDSVTAEMNAGLSPDSPTPGSIIHDPVTSDALFGLKVPSVENFVQLSSLLFFPASEALLMYKQNKSFKLQGKTIEVEEEGKLIRLGDGYSTEKNVAQVVEKLRVHLAAAVKNLNDVVAKQNGMPNEIKSFKDLKKRVETENRIFNENVKVEGNKVRIIAGDKQYVAADWNQFKSRMLDVHDILEAAQ